jgi:type I restriction enzyme S subunit
MSEWKTYKLGDLVEINKNSINKNYSFKEIEYLDTSSVTENRFSELQKLKISDAPSRAKRIVKENDVVYSTVRPILRHYGIVKNMKPNTIASTGFAVLTAKYIDPNFLYYYLTTDEIVYFLNSVAEANTTTYPAFNASLFENIEVTIPESIATQKEIAQILSSLDDKIELNLQMNQTLEAMAQAIFKEWFVDFKFPKMSEHDSYDFKMDMINNDNKKNPVNQVNSINPVQDNGLPKGWRRGKLGDISINFDSKRIPLSSRQRAERKGEYPYYGATSILDYVDDFIFDGTYLLMGEDGTVRTDEGFPVLQYVWGKFWVNNHTHVLQGLLPFSTEYLYLFLAQTNITNLITGAVQPKINQGNMNKIECILPTEDVLKKFYEVINPIFEKVKTNTKQIRTLTQLRDTLLPKLMSGKIRLNTI